MSQLLPHTCTCKQHKAARRRLSRHNLDRLTSCFIRLMLSSYDSAASLQSLNDCRDICESGQGLFCLVCNVLLSLWLLLVMRMVECHPTFFLSVCMPLVIIMGSSIGQQLICSVPHNTALQSFIAVCTSDLCMSSKAYQWAQCNFLQRDWVLVADLLSWRCCHASCLHFHAVSKLQSKLMNIWSLVHVACKPSGYSVMRI